MNNVCGTYKYSAEVYICDEAYIHKLFFFAFQKGIQHGWLRGLRRYLIGFAPHAFAPQCQKWARNVPSHLAFLRISKNLTSPLEIPVSSPILQCNRSISHAHHIDGDLTDNYEAQPTRHLRPIIPNNTCPLCITAAAGTDICRGFFCKRCHYAHIWNQMWICWKSFTSTIPFITHAI